MTLEDYLECGAYLPKTLDEMIAEFDARGYLDITEEDMMTPPDYIVNDLPF